MSVERNVFKFRHFECSGCRRRDSRLAWNYELPPPCCGVAMREVVEVANRAPNVIGDEIDIEVRHGICNEDGTPRRYTSKAEMRRVARARGLVLLGETPK